MRNAVTLLSLLVWAATLVASQLVDSVIEPHHPAIRYDDAPVSDAVADLDRRLQAGEARLEYEPRGGYLRSLLAALDVPVSSQIALFSATSLQARLVNSRNPRTIYFNDSVSVAWMSGGFIEVASLDARQGAVFYLLPQTEMPAPRIARDTRCLQCHYSTATLGIPGFLVRSIPSAIDGMILPWLGNYTTDHRSPIGERWGGWFVTGRGGGRHMGNAPLTDRTVQDFEVQPANLDVASLDGRFDTSRYLSPLSDIVALLVFDHQMRMMNLLIRLAWEARILEHDTRAITPGALAPAVEEVVDYLLFVDEAPLVPVRGSSGFAEHFSARGPRDSQGRSLRDLDLQQRLMKYPCSYMIYSEAFEAMPEPAKVAVYRRLWNVLSGADRAPKYSRISDDDRRAIVEILKDTKADLPAFFTLLPSRP